MSFELQVMHYETRSPQEGFGKIRGSRDTNRAARTRSRYFVVERRSEW